MTKDLKYFGAGAPGDPLTDIVAAVAAVAAINGHTPDDAELRELLDEQALPSDDESVQRLRAMLVDAGLGEGT